MRNTNCNTSEAEERRCFFRIDDNTIVQYRVIEEATEHSIKEGVPVHLTDRLTVGARFMTINREMRPLLNMIEENSPQIAQYLSAMDQKLDILAKLLLVSEEDFIAQPAQKVNISAGGISFNTEKPIPAGSILELRLVLYPSYTGIFTYAKVIYSKRTAKNFGGKPPFKTAVEFMAMKDEDRDLISQHVLCREAANLRRKQ